MTHVALTLVSSNVKVGPIPVSTTTAATCPSACPLSGKKSGGCYVESGPLAIFWKKVSAKKAGMEWLEFCRKVASLPRGQLWRHNQAGDLPGDAVTIDATSLADLVKANRGRRGFTYTHYEMTAENKAAVLEANTKGFIINLSANTLAHADTLAQLDCAPVVTILPSDTAEKIVKTPNGRIVAICPATYRDTNCARCQLCARKDRRVIVGFPAHGVGKKRVNATIQNLGE